MLNVNNKDNKATSMSSSAIKDKNYCKTTKSVVFVTYLARTLQKSMLIDGAELELLLSLIKQTSALTFGRWWSVFLIFFGRYQ